MKLKIYEYKKCGTCRKAEKFLQEKGIDYDLIPIRETPPTIEELQKMLGYLKGEIKRLLNTSGMDYRSLNMKEKLPKMSEQETFKLLNQNGNLIKRPFVLGKGYGTTGFKQEEWEKLFS